MVGEKGLEPSRLAARVPKTRVSAIPPLPRVVEPPPRSIAIQRMGVSLEGRS